MERVPEPELMDDPLQASAYAEADFRATDAALVERILAGFGRDPAGPILDLGCGPGNISFPLAQRCPASRVLGLDGASAMLAIAERRRREAPAELQGRLSFLQGILTPTGVVSNGEPAAADDRDLRPGSFRAVVSNSLLHHLHDPQGLWGAIRRLAAPGAAIHICDLRRPADPEALAALVAEHAAEAPPVLRRDYANSLAAAFRPSEVEAQLRQADLGTLQVEALADRYLEVRGRLPGLEEPT